MKILVENIRCGGCVGSITEKLKQKHQANQVEIDIEKGLITLDIEPSQRESVIQTLVNLGYPQVNSVQGFNKTKAKAKSIVSCAVGKFK